MGIASPWALCQGCLTFQRDAALGNAKQISSMMPPPGKFTDFPVVVNTSDQPQLRLTPEPKAAKGPEDMRTCVEVRAYYGPGHAVSTAILPGCHRWDGLNALNLCLHGGNGCR